MAAKTARVMPLEPDANMINAAFVLIETMPTGTPERHKRIVAEVWRQMAEVAPFGRTSGVTRLQARTHEIIADYINDNGRSPSYDEIGAQLGKRKSEVHAIVKSLMRREILTYTKGHHRSIRLIVQPGEQRK